MMRIALLVIAAAAGLVAGSAGPAAAVGGGEGSVVEVHIVRRDEPGAEFAFEPAEMTVIAGTTVRWVNDGDVYHTVSSTDSPLRLVANRAFAGRLFRAGDTFEVTFDRPGEYAYFCQPHADFMTGLVRVLPADEGAARPGTAEGA